MRKRIIIVGLVVCMISLSVSGCKKKDSKNNTVTVNEKTVVDVDND